MAEIGVEARKKSSRRRAIRSESERCARHSREAPKHGQSAGKIHLAYQRLAQEPLAHESLFAAAKRLEASWRDRNESDKE